MNYTIELISQETVEYFHQFKIIIVGNPGVGKSCLSLKSTKGIFDNNHRPTIGYDFFYAYMKINSRIIKLHIWDTCGQEDYNSLIKNYYKNASLAVIVYAVDNLESFKAVDHWINQVKTYSSPNTKIYLIGNKADLLDERKITYEMGEECRKNYEMEHFLETSAKKGVNTKDLLIAITRTVYEEYDKMFTQQNFNVLTNDTIHKLYNEQRKLCEMKGNKKKCCS